MAMEEGLGEEKMALLSKNSKSEHQNPTPRRKGGFITMPFIIVNESFEKVASYGLLPNMIFYLMNGYHLEAATGSIILSLWSSTSNVMAIFGAFLSDSYLGRFPVIVLGTLSSLLGMALLWSTSMIPWMKPSPCSESGQDCDSATPLQYLVLFSSFCLISIGAGCVRPCSMAFGADQVNNKENPDNERALDSFFSWYYASMGLSSVVALTVIVYIQDHFGWSIGFGVPVILMILSLAAFLLGSSLYVHVKVTHSLFTSFIQVLVAAYRKRDVTLPTDAEDIYFHRSDSKITTPSDDFRCLNKACVIRDAERELNPDGSASNPWSLCTLEQVENLKAIPRVMLIWSTGIVMLMNLGSSYTTLQAKTMDRHFIAGFEIPAGSFHVFSVLTITFWVAFYDRVMVPLLAKYFSIQRGIGPRVRMGLGLLLSCVSLINSGIVEYFRRKIAIDQGMEDSPDLVMNMSAMWLVPPLVLMGLAEAFNSVGQIEFFYSHLSRSMASVAMAIFTLGMAVASLASSLVVNLVDSFSSRGGNVSWLSSNINKGHVDYYYWLLAFLGVLNFIYFLICCRVSGPSETQKRKNAEAMEEDA